MPGRPHPMVQLSAAFKPRTLLSKKPKRIHHVYRYDIFRPHAVIGTDDAVVWHRQIQLWFGIDKFKNIFGQTAARVFMVLLVLLACTSLYFSYVRP